MMLPIILIAPIIGLLIMALIKVVAPKRKKLIEFTFLIIGIIELILSCVLLKNVLQGGAAVFTIPHIWTGAKLYADTLSAALIVLTSFLWVLIAIYAPPYMKKEKRNTLFNISTIATLAAVLGVFLSADFLLFLLFFELMTISSYFWVIHKWDKAAIKAGYYYLFFSITGGFLITLALALEPKLISSFADGISISTKGISPSFGLLVAGFGIKAGMVPLHLWLPHAHSVSPTPASALLSGLIIKVGAYGIIRTLSFLGFAPAFNLEWIGPFIIIAGIATMLTGVVAALLQSNAKRLLAYHSVSQMGYIILGLGVAFYLGNTGGLSLIGALYHIINHALFKVALFLGIGIIYYYTKTTSLYELGGLWRRFPVLAFLMLLAVLGISGAPFLNGYISKTILHHGLNAAVENKELWLNITEKLFNIVGVGTAASFTKLYYLAFIKKPLSVPEADIKTNDKRTLKNAIPMYFVLGIICVCMLVIGIKPMMFLTEIVIPAIGELGIPAANSYQMHISFWNTSDVFSIFITLILGVLVCGIGLKTGAFSFHPPKWLTIEGLAAYIYKFAVSVFEKVLNGYTYVMARVSDTKVNLKESTSKRLLKLDKSRKFNLGKLVLFGVSADAGIIILVLLVLIAGFTLVSFLL
ncbi:MAG TPA: proton-conducting transporter membrane subunit [Oscillospiraceae bacterium]|nr:proton-conducting transporter membrane subunit [Oscillospiraceae bacterium]